MAKTAVKNKVRRKDRILDSAEALFARLGFVGVSMRMVAESAQVDLALASYHFGNKRGLFDAVLARRSEIINERRQTALRACIAAAGEAEPKLEAIIDAFIQPLLGAGLEKDAGWRHYMELIALVNSSHELGGQAMTQFFDPLVKEFIGALKRVLPGAAEEDIYWSHHFFSGALTLTLAQTGRLDNLSSGKVKSNDLEAAYRRMVPFVTAGFKALCKPGKG